jgi:hypothetical protein
MSVGRHVAPLGHIFLSREAANTNFIVFGLTWPELKPTIYHTREEYANHYITDVVLKEKCSNFLDQI